MSTMNKNELERYGIKYTQKGTPYMLTNFLFRDHDENYQGIWQYDVGKEYDKLKEKWKYFHKTMEKPSQDQQEYRVTTSIMYKNGDNWERNPFADAAIGFVFQDGYEYKQMFMHNMHCGARPIKLDEKGKSIKSWEGKMPKEIWNEKQKEYEIQELTDETNEGYYDYYDNNKDVKSNETQFVEKSIEKDNLRKGLFQQKEQKNQQFETAVQKYNSGQSDFKPYYDDCEINVPCEILEDGHSKKIKCQYDDNGKILNYELYHDDLYLRHNRLTFQNNECHVDVWQPKIASLIINLTDRDIAEKAFHSVRNNKRWMRLKQIAYSMESIIKFQRDVLKKDKILFRDEEKQAIEPLTLEQFKNRITYLCIQHNNQCKDEREKIDISKMNCNNDIKNQLAKYGSKRGCAKYKNNECCNIF